MKPRLDVAVLKDSQAFAALEQEWDDLFHNCAHATPFQSWAWLYSWWEAYGDDYELRLVTVRGEEDGLLVGLIPLMLERRWGFSRLLFIGTGHVPPSWYLDVLVRRDWESKVREAGVGALRQMDGWHVAEHRNIFPTATIWSSLQGWNGPRIDLRVGACWEIQVKPWDELVKSLPKSQRTPARRTLRRAEEDGVRSVLAGPEEVEQATRRLVALHRELWRGRNIIPEHLTTRFESCMLAAARRMTDRGLGGISEFWRGEEVIVSSFLLFANDLTVPYLVGANQEAIQRYQWSTLFIWQALNIARSRGCSYVSLLTGDDKDYKQRWAKEVPYYQIILGRGLLLGGSYLAYRSLRSRVADYEKADASPEWFKNAVRWLRERGV